VLLKISLVHMWYIFRLNLVYPFYEELAILAQTWGIAYAHIHTQWQTLWNCNSAINVRR